MQREVVLALLAREPSYGYELQAQLEAALGPLGQALNGGQVYVTLARLEQAGLIRIDAGAAGRAERKIYALTPRGEDRVAEWLAEVRWPKPDLAEFHLKLVTAAAARLADPIALIDDQRRELLRQLRDAQRSARKEAVGSDAALLLEGVVLRLRADLRWLDACETAWGHRRYGALVADPGGTDPVRTQPGRPQL
jgi:DNA-binding PadR family transcriptional regulator